LNVEAKGLGSFQVNVMVLRRRLQGQLGWFGTLAARRAYAGGRCGSASRLSSGTPSVLVAR
jgi:hypothetical protein